MDTLELLTTRRSNKSLRAPAPDELQLDSILQAASQVPDHGNLTPWRFIVIQSEAGKQRFQAALPSPLQFAIIRPALRVGNSMPTCCL